MVGVDMKSFFFSGAIAVSLLFLAPTTNVSAQTDPHAGHDMHQDHKGHKGHAGHAGHGASHGAGHHAPIGVMGATKHAKGEFMLSARYGAMQMSGNLIGTQRVTPEEIATTVPNSFFGRPMQPPTLRVVPTDMTMDMVMVGAMYGLTDRVTLMAMGSLVYKEMDHITFQGGMGTTRLGEFTTNSGGVGDTKVGAFVGLFEGNDQSLQLNAMVSLPTGSLDETDQILTPMGGTPSPRLPYPMQIGSGTLDLEPGLTYLGNAGAINWGGQAKAVLRLGTNDEGYTLGDRFEATAWASYDLADWVSTSFRVRGSTQGRIDGADPLIVAPVQTAQPDFQGGDRLDLLVGANFLLTDGALKGNRLAVEAGFPVAQDLNGPQLETDFTLTIGWQLSF